MQGGHLATLFRSPSERLRTQALWDIALSGDQQLLAEVAKSDWRATGLESQKSLESWYGSAALVKAAAKGLLPHEEAVSRISPRRYGRAASRLDPEAVCTIAGCIDASIRRAAALDDTLVGPDISLQVRAAVPYEHSRYSVGERSPEPKDLKETRRRWSEGPEEFAKRQQRAHSAFLAFKVRLSLTNAQIILDCLGLEEFEAVVAADEVCARQWYDLFMEIPSAKLLCS